MSHDLLLTSEERKIFDSLFDELKEGWTVREEILSSFETPKQLQMRFHMSSLKHYPFFRELSEYVEAGNMINPTVYVSLIPEEVLPEFFFLIGARGLSSVILSVLAVAKTDDELVAISAWSHVRHDLLETNDSAS